ncbi:CdaR family transcriptional regulator [Haploplasma axanthum]|uniref:Sugar diacid regulator n=1 Tax=Haploplasma axanthum TaxID=29552 RepID=A0A449BCV3_HAPAX|nr:sugar diacid recognition domain-containing protein [Haploplasma axanthum]VEU80279.1 Sugar diacid regulator [Haploplasma axanthum]
MKKLSKQTAREIEREINRITGEKINVMNDEGIIIVSSDPTRVNTFHGGAKRIIDEKLEELVVEFDGEYDGAKRGANFPVIVDNEIIGVVGITGPYEEIEKYGKLMKKMIEIFMLETYLNEQKVAIKNIKQYFLNEWINSESVTNKGLINRGKELELDLSIKRRVILLFIEIQKQLTPYDEIMYLEKIEEKIYELVNKISKETLILNEKRLYTILSPITNDHDILKFCEDLKEMLESTLFIKVKFGIGTNNFKLSPKEQRKTAKQALQKTLNDSKRDIVVHSDLTFESLITSISLSNQEKYFNDVTRKLDNNDIKNIIKILKVYYQNDGSLKNTSIELNCHINTLQYQLKLIKEKTGYDPRSLKDSAVFVLLIEIYDNLF